MQSVGAGVVWYSDMRVKCILILYSQLLKKVYLQDKQWQEHPEVKCETIQVMAQVEARLNETTGPGWTAGLEGMSTVSMTTVTSLSTSMYHLLAT